MIGHILDGCLFFTKIYLGHVSIWELPMLVKGKGCCWCSRDYPKSFGANLCKSFWWWILVLWFLRWIY